MTQQNPHFHVLSMPVLQTSIFGSFKDINLSLIFCRGIITIVIFVTMQMRNMVENKYFFFPIFHVRAGPTSMGL